MDAFRGEQSMRCKSSTCVAHERGKRVRERETSRHLLTAGASESGHTSSQHLLTAGPLVDSIIEVKSKISTCHLKIVFIRCRFNIVVGYRVASLGQRME